MKNQDSEGLQWLLIFTVTIFVIVGFVYVDVAQRESAKKYEVKHGHR